MKGVKILQHRKRKNKTTQNRNKKNKPKKNGKKQNNRKLFLVHRQLAHDPIAFHLTT
jgi:hypothetical protein